MAPSPDAATSASAQLFGFTVGQIVQEIGYDADVDLDLRDAIEDTIDSDLEDEDTQEIVDAVIIWWRDDDGDLVDQLVDALAPLAPGAPIWLLVPKAGRPGHVEPAIIEESADLAGLKAMSSVSAAPDWSATRLGARSR
ncbi:DUF3052 domain-containing protein [Devriesea agamarum]|uniref:DUF3052 domain-containing protein n=1 Tax=Devriesea agamarum TaxID=472569 RepID=UPI00071D0C70|nr:DUF3052 domain-containing protein [Devriesea agamarum]